uniref:LARGE xylosyl- and glucuronyltransferase 1 n=1 Tax=Astyanax mexicanus TaxID=7994 RepID=A0A8B9GZC1_ASTMX
MLGMCRGRRKKFLAASLALLFIPALTWLYLSAANFTEHSSLDKGHSSKDHLARVEEENRALRRELSQPPKNPTHSNQHSNSQHGNQSHAHIGKEGSRQGEAQKVSAAGNSSDCVSQPVVDKCEVRPTSHLHH